MDHPGKMNFGLLIIRIIVGFSMAAFHGWGKITAPDKWVAIGGNMKLIGITFLPGFWGFMAGFAEFFCSILLILGLFFRPATTLLAITMILAVLRHLSLPTGDPGSGLSGASHAMELGAIYIALWFTGPGKYSLMPGIKKN
tara:strand:+ start:74126 stop:74548 length:423 start_codon:yes stop_codon:yes gene_type:complete